MYTLILSYDDEDGYGRLKCVETDANDDPKIFEVREQKRESKRF